MKSSLSLCVWCVCVCVFVVFDSIEDYCPGFKGLVVGKEVLTPPDLERIFGLTGGVRLTIWTVQHCVNYNYTEYIPRGNVAGPALPLPNILPEPRLLLTSTRPVSVW